MTEVRLTPSWLVMARLLTILTEPLHFPDQLPRCLRPPVQLAFLARLVEQARGTDNGLAPVHLLIAEMRRRRILLPALPVIERLTLARRAQPRSEAFAALVSGLTAAQRTKLDGLLDTRTRTGEAREKLASPSEGPVLQTTVFGMAPRR